MSRLDWPESLGTRTPASERTRNNSFRAKLGQTTQELAAEMDRLTPAQWRGETASGGAYTKSSGLPKHSANPDDPGFVLRWQKDDKQFAVGCDTYSRLRDNVREVFLWVRETRKRGTRPVATGEADFAAARLPPGDENAADGSVVAHSRPPHEVLGVDADAPENVVKASYRALTKEHHPDHGGSNEKQAELNAAREAMLDE